MASGQSFGEQAARFSLYTPFMAILIGFAANSTTDQPTVVLTLVVINTLLILAGLCLGVIALVSMRRFGRTKILGRAVVGVIFNAVILAAVASILLPAIVTRRLKSQLPGRWSTQVVVANSPEKVFLTLGKDGHFLYENLVDGTTTTSLSGSWDLGRDRVIAVSIEHVTEGDPGAAGKRLRLGMVESVDETQMTLKIDKGEEKYTRVP